MIIYETFAVVRPKCESHLHQHNETQQAKNCVFFTVMRPSRFQWQRALRRGFEVARLLVLWVRIPLGAWISVCCECCVLSDGGLCVGLITRPEESYRLCCVHWGWSRSPIKRGPNTESGRSATGKKWEAISVSTMGPNKLNVSLMPI